MSEKMDVDGLRMEKFQERNLPSNVDGTKRLSSESKEKSPSPESSFYADASECTENCWLPAVERLHKVIMSSDVRKNFASPEDALAALLEEVSKNDHITEKELLEKLQNGANLNENSATSNSDLKTAESHLGSKIPQFGKEESQDRLDDFQDASDQEDAVRHGGKGKFFKKLKNVARALTTDAETALPDVGDLFSQKKMTSNVQSFVDYAVQKLHEQWTLLFNLFMPWQQIQTLFFVCIVQIVGVQRLLKLLPVGVCYVAFMAMIYSTLTMFRSRTWLKKADNWQRLLKVFQSRTSSEKSRKTTSDLEEAAESFYSWQSTEPYLNYFLSLTIFIFAFALSENCIPNALSMCVLSAFMAFACFAALADRYDSFAAWAMALHAFSSAPAICNRYGLFQGKTKFLGYLFDNWHTFQVGVVRIELGLPALAVVLTCCVYLYLITAYPKRDVYTVVIPHLVCLAWWHTCLELFLAGRWTSAVGLYDLALAACVIWLITFPTMAGFLVVVAILIGQFRNAFVASDILKIAVTATILLLPFLYTKVRQYAAKKHILPSVGGPFKTTVLAMIIYGFLVFASIALLYGGSGFSTRSSTSKVAGTELTWTRYEQACSHGEDNSGNRLRQQIACSQLGGVKVQWKGTVQAVRVVKIDNFLEKLFSYLPPDLSERLTCFYGDRLNDIVKTNKYSSTLSILANGENPCTLVNQNVYTFEINVAGPWGQHMISSAKGSAVLLASNTFQDLVLDFEEGDVVEFTASFDEDALRYPPRLKVTRLQCSTCQNMLNDKNAVREEAVYAGGVWSNLYHACCSVFNFLCAPLLRIMASA